MCALPLRRQTMDIFHSSPNHLFQHIILHLLILDPFHVHLHLYICMYSRTRKEHAHMKKILFFKKGEEGGERAWFTFCLCKRDF